MNNAIDTSGFLNTAVGAVVSAGFTIRDRLGGQFLTSCKSCPADLVTEVDKLSQSVILETISNAFPDHRLVAEEDFCGEELALDHRPVWFIDPLDGTTNFVFGLPLCAVTIALAIEGKAILGVTYDPFRDELFTATKGGGAQLNRKPVRVDRVRGSIAGSLLVTGFPASEGFKNEMLRADFKKLFCKAADIRALGSAALELAYVACGRLTGYWEVSLSPWDVAAGMILVEEAGGKVSGLRGEELELGRFVSIVASNGLIHDELVEDLGYGAI